MGGFFYGQKWKVGSGEFFATNARIIKFQFLKFQIPTHTSNTEDFSDHRIWQASIKKEKLP
jgi:hypothetical protein